MKILLGPAESFAWFLFLFAQLISLHVVVSPYGGGGVEREKQLLFGSVMWI